jgi:hypothetical protein
MKLFRRIWLPALLVGTCVGTFVLATMLPAEDALRGIAGNASLVALVAAMFTIVRDEAAYHRQRLLRRDAQQFEVGVTSHMANTVFDKHVLFCEAYMREVHETVGALFREGPTELAMGCSQKLFGLRRDYAAWVPKSIALKLEPFENAVHRIGSKTYLVKALQPNDPRQVSALNESYAQFSNVLGLEKMSETDPDHMQEIAIENVKEEVRAILGINELFEIRSFIIHRAATYVRDNS